MAIEECKKSQQKISSIGEKDQDPREKRAINHQWTTLRKKDKAVLDGTIFAQSLGNREASWLFWQRLKRMKKKCVVIVLAIPQGFEDTLI